MPLLNWGPQYESYPTAAAVENLVAASQAQTEERLKNYLERRFASLNASIDHLHKRCDTQRECNELTMREVRKLRHDLEETNRQVLVLSSVLDKESARSDHLLDLVTRQERFIDELRDGLDAHMERIQALEVRKLAEESAEETVDRLAELKILDDFRLQLRNFQHIADAQEQRIQKLELERLEGGPRPVARWEELPVQGVGGLELPTPTWEPVDHIATVWELTRSCSYVTDTGVKVSTQTVPELFRDFESAYQYAIDAVGDHSVEWLTLRHETDGCLLRYRDTDLGGTVTYSVRKRSIV